MVRKSRSGAVREYRIPTPQERHVISSCSTCGTKDYLRIDLAGQFTYCHCCRHQGLISIKQMALIRDGCKCQKCGRDQSLTVHHLVARSAGGETVLGNVATLCKRCHDGWHDEERAAFERWRRLAGPIRFRRWLS